MALVLGVDIGTTSITALALDAAAGAVRGKVTRANQAESTAADDRQRGRSEWDAAASAAIALDCLADLAQQVQAAPGDWAGIGITGQQHGTVLVDAQLRPLTPFINWQDRRGDDPLPGAGHSYVQEALARLGPSAAERTGCRLAAGYLGLTLFWLHAHHRLPTNATACFLMDYFAALLTGHPPVTDATCAASSGIFDLRRGDWDEPALAALDLPRRLLPPVQRSGALLGRLTKALAERTGLPAGVPVFVGIGDNQASFLGSVADRRSTALVNVGTGAQTAAFSDRFCIDPEMETRPFPGGGYLLVCAGLCGGRSYALLERFYREVGRQFFQVDPSAALYEHMNRLAESVPRGADGLRCDPTFTGTRAHPELRASWTGLSAANFTPAHMTRSLLEGLARSLHEGFVLVTQRAGLDCHRLVGAGNGLRENPLLARIVAEEFGMPLHLSEHREEAAYGAALLAAVGTGICADLASAGQRIRYA